MRTLILLFSLSLFTFTSFAQDSDEANVTDKGGWLVEINTGTWATGSTALSRFSSDGVTLWSIGAEAGYFVADDIAIKFGLGYQDADLIDGIFTYKVGAKYYINGQIPVGVDFTGISTDGNGANWVGIQAGYAWMVTPHVAIEPTLRYNLTLDEMDADSAFQGLIGFVLFL